MPLRPRFAALLVAPLLLVSACGSSSDDAAPKKSSSTPSASATCQPAKAGASSTTTKVGVSVSGDFGTKPTLSIPATKAPTKLSSEVLTAGTGDAVVKGNTLVANYTGMTWTCKDGKPYTFDSSFEKGAPAGFPIGTGAVIKGWDQTLVGQRLGSRLLLSIPPALGYGAKASTSNELAGKTLVFVVDLVGQVDPKTASANGTPVKPKAGFPAVSSASGKEPSFTSVAGVKQPTKAASSLLIAGTGPAIDTSKTLALQLVQTDLATGKQTQKTWGDAVQLIPAQSVLSVAEALKNQKIGSRVVVVTPSTTEGESGIGLIIDVVGQF